MYVFVRDRETDELFRILGPDGEQFGGPAEIPEISNDGNTVVHVMGWYGSGDPMAQIYTWDRTTNETRLVGENASGEPASLPSAWGKASGNGRWAVFESNAPDFFAVGPLTASRYAFAVSLE